MMRWLAYLVPVILRLSDYLVPAIALASFLLGLGLATWFWHWIALG